MADRPKTPRQPLDPEGKGQPSDARDVGRAGGLSFEERTELTLDKLEELEPGGLGVVAAPPQVQVHDWPWRQVAEERPNVGALAAPRRPHYLETPTLQHE